ncbi:tetratricopeptide (TPR) repeat protein [Saccharothrix tamanrassetensis]|uniref:Tetratricopeptide (TPR) repeat protein n=1 Tax=Saccharothrix tamanrassetensis TaxID=1051531 RepID=A0A841CE07_9PSEU|nr:tetratricopeptide repeat protein [Saccharothrix tamanrassetensis]MBB5954594.1 tetratricopeptide (TPR) repeat protein [Saccharothrix tamanrassetensis]
MIPAGHGTWNTHRNTVGGDVHGPVIQARDVHLTRPAPTALAGLPPLDGTFTGRAGDLARLEALLAPGGRDAGQPPDDAPPATRRSADPSAGAGTADPGTSDAGTANLGAIGAGAANPGTSGADTAGTGTANPGTVGAGTAGSDIAGADSRPVLVSAVAGLAGVGKTTLAVRAAHRFPGGVLFTDLRGYSADPVRPAEALAVFLHALGVPAEHIPPDVAGRTNLYRSVLATRPDPLLVLLDNAATADQVRPLLPGNGAHRVLITSRELLGELNARQVPLDVLPPDEAEALVVNAVRARNPHRPVDGPLTELADLCGRLPLALGIAAALLAEDADLSVAGLVDLLGDATNRLDELDYAGDYAVRAAFDLSYRRMPEPARRMFRLLSLNPGPHVGVAAAAALADLPPSRAKRLLTTLRRAHMVESAGAGRVRFHDLLRIYAAECRLREEPDRAALDRLLDHYLRLARDEQPWSAQLEQERPNLVAAADLANDALVVDLALALRGFFGFRNHWGDGERVCRRALDAARRLGQRQDEGELSNWLAMLALDLRRPDDASEHAERALAIHRGAGYRRGVAVAVTNLADCAVGGHDFSRAADLYREALHAFRESDDRYWMATVLNRLGELNCRRLEHEAAGANFRAALWQFRALGLHHDEARVIANLGVLRLHLGDLAEARQFSLRALEIFRDSGDEQATARVLLNLGILYDRVRLTDQACAYWTEAREKFLGLGDVTSAGQLERWLADVRRQR